MNRQPISKTVVFFVDDDDAVRAATRKVLEREDYRVIEAGTAEEARTVLAGEAGQIDILLMDIYLPDGWGASLAQELLSSRPDMVTVYTTGAAKEDPILAGGLGQEPLVLQKPFTIEELLQVMEQARSASEA